MLSSHSPVLENASKVSADAVSASLVSLTPQYYKRALSDYMNNLTVNMLRIIQSRDVRTQHRKLTKLVLVPKAIFC